MPLNNMIFEYAVEMLDTCLEIISYLDILIGYNRNRERQRDEWK